MSRPNQGIALFAAIAGTLVWLALLGLLLQPRIELRVERSALPSDGNSQMRIVANGRGLAAFGAPRLRLLGARDARLVGARRPAWGVAEAALRAGRETGVVTVEAISWGARVSVPVRLESLARDSFQDGLPDAMRLDDPADGERFRRWFSFIAEIQYYYPSADATSEVDDCAALIRYAFHEALRRHDGEWRRRFASPIEFPIEDVEKYSYPRTPLGPALFRTKSGPLAPSDLGSGTFREFADAETLVRFNAHPLGRRAEAARKGDLLVFHQPRQKQPFHTMIYVGASELLPGEETAWVVYHTGEGAPEGPDGRPSPGMIKKLPLRVLQAHPAARWRPIPANPSFLGYYRFNILR